MFAVTINGDDEYKALAIRENIGGKTGIINGFIIAGVNDDQIARTVRFSTNGTTATYGLVTFTTHHGGGDHTFRANITSITKIFGIL